MPLSRSPGDEPAESNELDYFSQYLKGDKSPDDAKYEPELQDLLAKLYDRQSNERSELLGEQIKALEQVKDRRRIGDPDLREEFRGHFDDDAIAEEHHQEEIAQQDRFAEERERYISEYQKAREIRDQMRQDSREETLEQSLEDRGHPA